MKLRYTNISLTISALCALFVAMPSVASPDSWKSGQSNRDEAVYGLIATFASTCPIDPSQYVEDLSKQRKHFLSPFFPVLLGKSVELLQHDLCQIFKSGLFPNEAALFAYCDANPALSKATAKSLGKVAKTFQNGKSGFALGVAGISAYGSVKLSERLLRLGIAPSNIFSLFVLAIAVEQATTPDAVEVVSGEPVDDYYVAFDHWLARPFGYRTMTTGCRYALEKIIQQFLNSQLIQKGISIPALVSAILPLSQRSAEVLAKGSLIGASKVATGALAAQIISASEIILDAYSEEPEYPSAYLRAIKFAQDTGLAIATNVVFSLALPATLLAGRPVRIVLVFAAAHSFWSVLAPASNAVES